MRVLYLSPFWPVPADNGSKTRILSFLQTLSQRYEVAFLGFHDRAVSAAQAIKMEQLCQYVRWIPRPDPPGKLEILANLFSRTPLGVRRQYSPLMTRELEYAIESFSPDVLFVCELWMAQYVMRAQCKLRIIDKHNIEFIRSRRRVTILRSAPFLWRPILGLAYQFISSRLRAYELEVLRQFDRCIVCSSVDREILSSTLPGESTWVVPNGVWANHSICRPTANSPAHRLVFTGTMSYEPNVDAMLYFCKEILPLLSRRFPDLHLAIVGSNPARSIVRLGSMENVTVTHYVEDVSPYLNSADVFVAPLRMGSGTRIKILEAMAYGLPVVSTSIGCEGLAVINNQHLQIADTAEALAETIGELLMDAGKRKRIGLAGYQLVQERYLWTHSQSVLLDYMATLG